MMTLIVAAAVAAQPALPANPHGQMGSMNPQQHEAMMEKCCCKDMGKGEHDMHAPKPQHQGHSGE